jgi:hypothetical protein
MANHLKRQIRDAVIGSGVLGNLTTTAARVYDSRVHPMLAADMPGLRIYTAAERVEAASNGPSRVERRFLDLVVEACVKSTTFDDTVDLIQQEIEVALAANQSLGAGVKAIQLRETEDEMDDEAEQPVCVRRMTFEVLYYTALGAPDVAL